MAITIDVLNNVVNAALDYHMQRGQVLTQSIQDKPLLKMLAKSAKTFPGGKGNITLRIVGDYTSQIMGYTYDDQVTYANPANIKTITVPWKEIHAGIAMTLTELKEDGISVVDSMNGKNTTEHSQRELTVLANILQNKLDDLTEGWARSFNKMLWQDGTQDAKQVPGIQSLILDNPTSATVVAGIDQSASTWWQNRASLGIDSSTASNQNLVSKLQYEIRQLRRYGGRPDTFLCGSSFIDAFEKELRSKGNYTLEGWMKTGAVDPGMADVQFKGIMLQYDPTLDDLGRAKYGYLLDSRKIFAMSMDGEGTIMAPKQHSPARPEDRYVKFNGLTWTGGLICSQRNANGVYSIN